MNAVSLAHVLLSRSWFGLVMDSWAPAGSCRAYEQKIVPAMLGQTVTLSLVGLLSKVPEV